MYINKEDIDYWNQLSEKDRDYLNAFLAEHYAGSKTYKSPTLDFLRTNNPDLSEDQIQEAYRQYRNGRKRSNYARKMCALNRVVDQDSDNLMDRASGFEPICKPE